MCVCVWGGGGAITSKCSQQDFGNPKTHVMSKYGDYVINWEPFKTQKEI